MNKLKKITLRSVIDEGDIIPQNAMKHILGGYSCGCAGSYCVTNNGAIAICCGDDMEQCYKHVTEFLGREAHSCGNCAG